MTPAQQHKISSLIDKYNDVLLNSMRLAVAEDFINLIILNRDDTDFELKDFLKDKENYYQFILKEFLKRNSSPVAAELGKMESSPTFRKTKPTKEKTPNGKSKTKPGSR
jgi:hypothetical protein